MLKTRSGKFANTDDDENIPNITNVYTEKNFVHVNQTVEKTAVDHSANQSKKVIAPTYTSMNLWINLIFCL